jgi:hypothetical protein
MLARVLFEASHDALHTLCQRRSQSHSLHSWDAKDEGDTRNTILNTRSGVLKVVLHFSQEEIGRVTVIEKTQSTKISILLKGSFVSIEYVQILI